MFTRMLIAAICLSVAAPALADGTGWLVTQPEADLEPGQVPDAAAQPPPDPDSWFKGWTGSVELGLNGSEGNTETLSFLGRVQGARDVSKYTTSFDISYFTKRDDGNLTEDRFDSLLRNDWKFGDSPWRLWAEARYQYDGFKEWDSRLSLFAGPGYVFIEDDETFLMGRAGLGATKEFGSERNEWQPEGLLGVDFRRQLTERQKISATVEYIPSLQHVERYRLRGKADWELVVDPEISMSLKVGIEDEYNSDPGGDDKRNDFRYYVLLVWSF